MRCPSCNADNPADARFCIECGSSFRTRCAKCGAQNLPQAKFCAQCGATLSLGASGSDAKSPTPTVPAATALAERPSVESHESLDGERKTVTALFADIKGSMELMEDLDPEEARAIVDPALKLMIDAVHRYDGHIVQSTGDGIFALFGAPVAHEDHPQRALYAALRLQEDMRRYSGKPRESGNLPIEARVGVNSGEVVVRSIKTGEGHAEYTPIGHSTSLAARMQALAPTGSIALTDVTRKLCEGYFTFRSLGPTVVKGVTELVNVYEVTALGQLRTRLQRAAVRGLTKFVGRQREMEALRHALEQARAGHGQIVAAMAEPGVGKSRLFYEFKAVSQSGCMLLEALSVSYGKASAYLPVIDLLQGYFGIEPGDDGRKRREKVTGRIVALDRNLEDTLPYIFGLLGIVEGDDPLAQMDGQVRKRRTLEAIKRILLRESLNQPLMVLFEDLHWIDEATQELLNLLADSIGTAKILLMVNYRPEYSHGWNSKTYYTQLRLDPLGKESAAEMLAALLGDGQDLTPLKRLIIKRTEGMPFFMEEFVQAMFEDGVLQRNGVVKLAKSMNTVKVPTTVQAVLASRIDRLPVEEKELLQTLAVLGREFALGLVRRVTQKPDDELERMLANLQMAEFIYEKAATGDTEYIFKHALTQQVAYNSLLIERRKLLHERAGEALELMFAEELDDHLGDLAHHYGHSDNVEKAVEYLGRAGQQALLRSAYVDAISSLSAAIDLLQRLPDGPERIRRELLLQMAVGPALIAIKGRAAPEVERTYTRARELCERAGDPPEVFPTSLGLWYVHLLRGELRTAYEIAEQLLRRAQSAQDPVLLLYAGYALGVTSFRMGELLPAREHLETAISLYDPERHRPLAHRYLGVDAGVICLCYAAWILWHLGYPSQALRRGNEALGSAQALWLPFSLAFAELFFVVLRQYRRETGAVQEAAEGVIALCTEHEFPDWLAIATGLHAWAMATQGRHEEGLAQMQEGLFAYRATGAELWCPHFLCLLAEACRETGRVEEGLRALAEALAAADEHEIRHHEAEIHRLKGELLLKQKNTNVTEPRAALSARLRLRASRALGRLNCARR